MWRCRSLYPWAVRKGRGIELASAFLHTAFFDGIDTNKKAGLHHVAEAADPPRALRREDTNGFRIYICQPSFILTTSTGSQIGPGSHAVFAL